ncbi:MAG: rhamnulose-1-phosphate aldolase [Bacteroidetes bacterium]|nr:rhamnulose-1-phosphate aldolase [Bacteroidota bacterium]
MQIQEIIAEIADTAQCLWDKGWAERNAGNISVNITELLSAEEMGLFEGTAVEPLHGARSTMHDQVLIVTTAGSRMRDLAKNPWDHLCVLKMNSGGNEYQLAGSNSEKRKAKSEKPTSELPTHLSIHEMLLEKNPELKTVVHTHATELIALTHIPDFKSADSLNRLLWGMHPETMLFIPKGAGFIPYLLTGSMSIAEASAKALEDHTVVIWEKHGVIATGTSVTEAFDTIDLISKSARIYFLVKQAGIEPEGLTAEQIKELANW